MSKLLHKIFAVIGLKITDFMQTPQVGGDVFCVVFQNIIQTRLSYN
jgi:hypothetical protein